MGIEAEGKWLDFAYQWPSLEPPSTPSIQDISHLTKEISGTEHIRRVAVLGSTPTLRMAIAQIKNVEEIICVDFSRKVFDAMSAHISQELERERFVEANWLDISSAVGAELHAIVGDKSIDNVPLGSWPDLFQQFRMILKTYGLLILHVGFPNPALANASFADLIDHWAIRLETEGIDLSECTTGLWEDILSASYSPARDYLSIGPFRAEMLAFKGTESETILLKEFLKFFEDSWDARWTAFDFELLTKIAADAGFKVLSCSYSDDYEAANHQPIVCFQKI